MTEITTAKPLFNSVLPLDAAGNVVLESARVEPVRPGALGLYLGRIALGSRRAVAWRLKRASELCTDFQGWERLEYHQAIEIRGRARELYAPSTASSIVSVVRGVVREAWRAGFMDGERFRRIESVPNARGCSAPIGRWVTRPELRNLFACVGGNNIGLRDQAMLVLMFGAGMRRGEIGTLRSDDVTHDAITVHKGKGGKGRRIYMGASAQRGLAPWIKLMGYSSAAQSTPFLRQVDKSGKVSDSGIGGEAIRRRVLVLCERADVAPFRPHDARRTYASNLLDLGVDLAVVSRLLGHASIQVTAGYDRRDSRAETDAAGLVLLPVSSHAEEPESAQ